jgi:FlaA1/EpsC-like NDP-sugar epimerase
MSDHSTLLARTAAPLLALPRVAKRALVLGVDACLCVFTVWLALSLRFDAWVVLSGRDVWAVGVSLSLALPLFVKFGLYRSIFRYSGWPAVSAVAKAVGIYAAAYGLVFAAIGVPGVPRTIGLIQPLLLLLAVSVSRLLARGWLGGVYQGLLSSRELPRVLIYGAGDAGRKLAQALSASSELRLLGFFDDDKRLHGGLIHGLPVHDPATLKEQVAALHVSDIFLAIPSASRQRRHEILEQVRQVRVSVRTLPGLMELAQGKVQVSDLRELEVEDLLGRNAVPPHAILLGKNVRGKVVLVNSRSTASIANCCRDWKAWARPRRGSCLCSPPWRMRVACARSWRPGIRTRSTMPRPISTCRWWSTTRRRGFATTCSAR